MCAPFVRFTSIPVLCLPYSQRAIFRIRSLTVSPSHDKLLHVPGKIQTPLHGLTQLSFLVLTHLSTLVSFHGPLYLLMWSSKTSLYSSGMPHSLQFPFCHMPIWLLLFCISAYISFTYHFSSKPLVSFGPNIWLRSQLAHHLSWPSLRLPLQQYPVAIFPLSPTVPCHSLLPLS